MLDNRDPQVIGEALLSARRLNSDMTFSQIADHVLPTIPMPKAIDVANYRLIAALDEIAA